MEMKNIIESAFPEDYVPDLYYIAGNSDLTVFFIAKFEGSESFFLYALNTEDKNRICLKCDAFENLIKIVNLLLHSFTCKVYYDRCLK